MSENVNSNKKAWFVFEWGRKLGDQERPYAKRWRADFYFFSFRIHKWLCSDDERAYHSHPVNMIVFILKGSYIDHNINSKNGGKFYEAPAIRVIKRDDKHYIHLWRGPVWTFLITWGAPQKWAFWLKDSLRKKNRDRYFIEHGNHICE